MSHADAFGTQRPLEQLLCQRLESLRFAGVTHLPRRSPARPTSPKTKTETASATPAVGEAAVRKAAPAAANPAGSEASRSAGRASDGPTAAASRVEALAAVAQKVARCTRCPELARARTQTVFGVGNPQARLCFVGEAPGADEDRQGEPFVGAAGQLLNKILAACGLRREEVYIMNILRCRPPGNRTPLPDEAANCREYLDAQLEILRPEFICCLGACAAQNLLQTTLSIGKLRGALHAYGGFQVVCTYHPAYLLRNPAAKAQTWDDMKLLMQAMGVELPQR